MDSSRRSILQSTVVISGLTILSRILGLVREQVRAYYIGTGMASDAFGIASTIPNMLRRLFAEGAMTAAFVPVFTGLRTDGDRERLSRFYSGFMTLFLILMAFVTLMGILAAAPLVTHVFAGRFEDVPGKLDLTIALTEVMFPYLFLVAVAAIVQAALNGFGVFGPSAFTPVLLNGANIAVVVLFSDRFPNAAWALAVGFLVGGFLQLGFQIPFLRGQGIRYRPTLAGLKDPAVWQVAVIFLPGIFSAGIYQINVTVSQVIAASLDAGSVSSLQYSLRLQELVLGVFAVSVATVILPTMSQQAHKGDLPALKGTLNYSIGLLGFVTIPASVGLMMLGGPIVTMLFQYGQFDAHSTDMTSFALYFHGAGVFFIALYRNVVQVFYARKDLKTPPLLAAVTMVLHVGLCYWLAVPLGHGGVAAAGSLAAAFNAVLLLWVLRRRIGPLNGLATVRSLAKTVAATAVMSAVVAIPLFLGWFQGMVGWQLAIRLVPVIIAAAVVYVVASHLAGSEELGEFARLLKRRLKSS